MKKELENNIFNSYPDIFREVHQGLNETQSCLAWGIECDDGWYQLIKDLCEELNQKQKEHNIEIIARQVKEKFGELRFYYDITAGAIEGGFDANKAIEEVRKIVSKYENQSCLICEVCGESGKIRPGGWIRTLCNKHYKK